MLVLTHATGNANSRQALLALHERQMLDAFFTTLAWDKNSRWERILPSRLRAEFGRRSFEEVPLDLIHAYPVRELGRLVATKAHLDSLTMNLHSPVHIANVIRALDKIVERYIQRSRPAGVYGYCTMTLDAFRVAKTLGLKKVYELPSAYWHFWNALLLEESQLQPGYFDSLNKLHVDPKWVERQDQELELADHLIVPCSFVRGTLPKGLKARVHVIPYGAPTPSSEVAARRPQARRKLRVLYVGGLTQRKGISYAFDAISALGDHVEFTVIGRRLGDCAAIDRALQKHRWLESVPHSRVLQEMQEHDVLLFPTLSEGFGMVVTEAMSRGMVVITTSHSCASDVLTDGESGFVVPIRSSEAIVQRLEMLAADPGRLAAMSLQALERARQNTWALYRERLGSLVEGIMHHSEEYALV